MKTPLQQLFEYMEQNQYFIGNDLLAKYEELIELEKQQIIDAHINGQSEFDKGKRREYNDVLALNYYSRIKTK